MSTRSRRDIPASDPDAVEYDFTKGERGKYLERYRAACITVRIEPDVAQVFPDAAAVNAALRKVIRESRG
jgi:hypothetical protein